MGEADEAKIPRLKDGANFKTLPLEPADGYILSQMDGRMPLSEIGLVTGLGEERVQELIVKLEAHGVIEWVGVNEATAPRDDRRSGRRAKRPPVDIIPPRAPRQSPRAAGKPKPKPKEPKVAGEPYTLSEIEVPNVELGPERRKAILRTFYTMDELTLYEVLGVGPDSDKKEIRTAYFRLSKQFHPDTLYGKELGPFKAKMVAVFKRLTEAYEVLGKKKRRAEYDAYIGLRLKALRAEQRLEKGKVKAAEVVKERESENPPAMTPPPEPGSTPDPPRSGSAAAVRPERSTASTPSSRSQPAARSRTPGGASSPRPSPRPSQPPAGQSSPPRPSTRPSRRPSAVPTSEAARDTKRRLMARKLAAAAGRQLPGQRRSSPPRQSRPPPSSVSPPRASQSPPRRSSGSAPARSPLPSSSRSKKAPLGASSRPPGSQSQVIRGLATSLKMSAVHTGGVDMAQRYVAQAKRDEQAGDLVSAANYLRLALALAPERTDVLAYHDRIALAVAVDLADTYKAQAAYEEKNGKWAEAALSWGKVCEGRPNDPEAHWKAALGLLKASGDLARAKQYAQRAVDLDGGSFDAKKTLGLIFHSAGMPESARRLLEEAKALDPRDEMVENLLRELK